MNKPTAIKQLFIMFALMLSYISSAWANVSDEDVYSYLNLSGTEKALNAIPAQIQGMGQQLMLTSAEPEKTQKVFELIVASWQQDVINKQVFDFVKANINAAQMQELLVWLKSDLATRIKRSEEKASDPAVAQELMRYMANTQNNPPTAERIAAVRKFVETTQVIDYTTELVLDMTEVLIDGFETVLPETEKTVDKEAQLQQMEAMMRPALEQQIIMSYYYVYDSISGDDLNQYIEFYQQPIGEKEIKVMYGAIGQAMSVWAETMAKDLATDIKNNMAE